MSIPYGVGMRSAGNAKNLTNAALMHVDFLRLSPFCSVDVALKSLAERGDRYAIVETENRLLGLVSDRDLRSAMVGLQPVTAPGDVAVLEDSTVLSVCIRRPFTGHPHGLAIASAQFMLQKRIGCLPIVDVGTQRVLGLLTLRDFTRVFVSLLGPPTPYRAQDHVVS